VLHPSSQIRPKKGLMGLKIGHVCPVLALSGLRSNVQGSNRLMRLQPGLQGLTQSGGAGREKDLSPGMHVLWVHERPFSTKIRACRPKKKDFFDSGMYGS